VSVKAPLPDAPKTFLNTEVSATVVTVAGPSAACVGGVVDGDGDGGGGAAGAEAGVCSGAAPGTEFFVSSATAAFAAASSFASLRSSNTFACAYSGNGSINSRRRRISKSSVGDAPVASSNFSSANTSGHVKPPVSNARKTFANTTAAGEVLGPICVVRRHTYTMRPRIIGGLGFDHELITLNSPGYRCLPDPVFALCSARGWHSQRSQPDLPFFAEQFFSSGDGSYQVAR